MPQDSNRSKRREMPIGRIWLPAFLCSLVATTISLILDLLNAFQSFELSLTETLKELLLFSTEFAQFSQLTSCLLIYTATFFFSASLLDSPRLWRKFSLCIIVITLTFSLSLALAIWGYLFIPTILVAALICCFILCLWYTSRHQMPCEAGEYKQALPKENKPVTTHQKEVSNIGPQKTIKNTSQKKQIEEKRSSIPLPRVADSNHSKTQE